MGQFIARGVRFQQPSAKQFLINCNCVVCVQARDLQELQNRFNAAEGANLMLARSQGESLRLAEAARAEAARARDALAPATAEIRYAGVVSLQRVGKVFEDCQKGSRSIMANCCLF